MYHYSTKGQTRMIAYAKNLTPPHEGWLTIADAAEALGCAKRTLQLRCAAGTLHAVKDDDGTWWVDPRSDARLRVSTGQRIEIKPTPEQPQQRKLASLPKRKRADLARKLRAVRNYIAARTDCPRGVKVTELTRLYVDSYNTEHPDHKITRTSLLRWHAAYVKDGVSALVDSRDYFGDAQRISPEALDFILGFYADQKRPQLAGVYEKAQYVAKVHNWHLPHISTVRRIINGRIDKRVVMLGRQPKKFRDRQLPTAVRDQAAIYPNQLWVADHRHVDFFVPARYTDSKGAERITWWRPWLTCFLDFRTWKPVAWRFEFRDPNADRVMGTFIDGVNEHGLPQHLYLDNGKDFRAKRFAGGRKNRELVDSRRVEPLLEMLNVGITWAIPYNAKAKVIEPFFRLMSEKFDKTIFSYCGNNQLTKPEDVNKYLGKDAEDYIDTFNLDSVRQMFDAWIADDYCRREAPTRSCKGMSVDQAFYELRPDDYVEVRPPAEDLAVLLLPSRQVRVEPNGVYVRPLGRYYYAELLDNYRATGKRVTYRYNEADASHIYVFDAETDRFICAAGPYIGNDIHPLASTDFAREDGLADDERLSEVMEMRNGLAKRTKAELTRVQKFAGNVLLAVSGQAASATGRLWPAARHKAPAQVVVPFMAGGNLAQAVQAGKAYRETAKRNRQSRREAGELLATGTAGDRSRQQAPDALALLVTGEHEDDNS